MIVMTAIAALVLSQAAATPVDISAWKANARALTDGKGHYVVYDAEAPYETMFYGDEKTLAQLRIRGGSKDARKSWTASLWETRLTTGGLEVAMNDSGRLFSCTCGKRETALTPLGPEETQRLLGAAVFMPPLWTRRPERLLRDDRGTYYFVDRLRTEDDRDRRDFRIFIGPRGKMKQLPLKDVVDDSEGMVFSTRDGVLRLVFGREESAAASAREEYKWVEGKRVTTLTSVPLDAPMNVRLVYTDLGPYFGARLGTPCDDLM